MIDLPQAESADPDGVQVALRAAQALWSRGDTSESLRWLRRAAESASDEGADVRSLQLAKAAAELRAKLFVNVGDASASIPPPAALPDAGLSNGPAADAALAGAGSASSPPPAKSVRADEAHPPSRPPPSGSPQYVVHRPREATRQLMGLSSSTLDAVQRDNATHSPVPSWSADGDRRMSSAPPPLPRAALDDYEELDAEPDEEAGEEAAPWSNPAPTWRGRSDSATGADVSSEGARNAPSGAAPSQPNPPPLPSVHAFGEDDDMRPEQPTVVIPPPEEARAPESRRAALAPREGAPRDGLSSDLGRELAAAWSIEARSPSWDGGSWDEGGIRGFSSGAAAAADGTTSLSEPAPPKLTARVHHQAVQVSFAPDPRVSGQFIVRPLREGERIGAGERIGLLVALEPGLPLV